MVEGVGGVGEEVGREGKGGEGWLRGGGVVGRGGGWFERWDCLHCDGEEVCC